MAYKKAILKKTFPLLNLIKQAPYQYYQTIRKKM